MSIDHASIILFNNNQILRFFGRIAFPLYGFLLVEGFKYTKNDKKRFLKYLISIFFLAIISEPIYNLALHGNIRYFYSQNILFTLSSSLLCMYIYDKYSNSALSKFISMCLVMYISFISQLYLFDYGFLGVFLIFAYYLISTHNYNKIYYFIVDIIFVLLNMCIFGFSYVKFGVLLSLIPIYFYSGKKGYNSKLIKYFFYLYYPAHLFLLFILK